MRIGIASPIPDLGSIPGPSRPGWPSGAFEFKLEIQGPATLSFNALKSAGGTNFSIDWGDGTTASGLTGTSHSHTYGSGTFTLAINSEDDSGPIDQFQITGSQTNKNAVKEILNWGTTPWVNLTSAFQDCHGLTSVNKSDFYSGSTINLTSAFQNCDNLATVDFTGWKASGNVTGANMFRDCTALESFKLKGSINFANASSNNYWFRDSGASTGCLFDISDLSFVGSTGNQGSVQGWFFDTQIKNGSKFDNWTFPAANWALNQFFYDAHVPDNDATISIQNWTLPNNASTALNQLFRNLQTDTGSGTNLTLNMSNWNFGNITGLVSFMQNARMSSIVGLSTWTANNLQNINNFFATTASLGIDANDNFTTSFWNNSNISSCNFAFQSLGGNTTSTTAGAFPALNGMTVASGASFQQIFENTHFNSDASFTGVTFPSTTINFSLAFYTAEFFNSNSTIDFSNSNLKSFTYDTTFRRCKVDNIVFGSNVDFSAVTSWLRMFKADTGDTSYPDQNVTFPTNISFAATTDTREFPNIPFTTCQADNLIRALYSTKPTASGNANTFDLTTSAITAAPSVVNGLKDKLVSPGGWNITVNSTDAALPFAYPAYALDPTSYPTGISPTTIPSGAVFSTTTSGVTVNASTGAISYASTFRGGITIKCTYTDGCYNEVQFIVQVPFVMRTVIPGLVAGTTYLDMEVKPQMSAGECFVDWGDSNSETLTGNTTHTYAAAGTYDIKIFDSPSGSKLTGFTGQFTGGTYVNSLGKTYAYDKSIMQWGEIEWQNNSWFTAPTNMQNQLRISAPNGAAHKPNLSQVTSLQSMFAVGSKGPNQVFEDVNNNLADWDVSTITNMYGMFMVSGAPLNRPSDGQPNVLQLGNWDVSNVTTFNRFSFGALQTANGVYKNELGYIFTNWDTSAATDMSYMFHSGSVSGPNVLTGVENFDTSNVTDMSYMFTGRNISGIDFKTKLVNGTVRWSVKKVTNFNYTFGGYTYSGGEAGGFSDSTFPTNWWISGENQDVSMAGMFGYNRHSQGRFVSITDNDAFATKTIASGNSPYGSSYTAWDMSNTTNLNSFAYTGRFNNIVNRNWNISSWQISDKCTNLNNLFTLRSTSFTDAFNSFDQDLGHWNIENVTAINNWMSNVYPGREQIAVNLSLSNYDSLLSITDGWGQHATNAQSGVTLNMGASQYSIGDYIVGTSSTTSAANVIVDAQANFNTTAAVGDVVVDITDLNNLRYSKITSVDSNTQITVDQNYFGAYLDPYRIEKGDAAKGRYALIQAGWNINDGGAYIPPAVPLKLKINVTAGQTWKFPYYNPPSGTSYHIDFGDGNGFSSTPYTSDATHTYTNAGDYIVQVGQTGDIVNVTYEYGTGVADQDSIVEIQQWPENLETTIIRFQRRNNTTPLAITATNIPDFKPGTSIRRIFANYAVAPTDTGSNLEKWKMDNVENVTQAGFSGGWPAGNYDTKQVTYNGKTYIAWNIVGLTTFDGGSNNIPPGSNWQLGPNFTSLYNARLGKNNADLERKQITVGTGSTAITYTQWDTENVTTWSGSAQACFAGGSTGGMNNYSVKNWIINYTLSNTSSFLYFGFPWNQAVGSTAYDNIWIGIAIGVYNGWQSEKGTNYAAGYLTDLNVQMNANFNGKMNQNTSISSSIHPNKPSGWSTLADGIDYLIEEQGWTIQYT